MASGWVSCFWPCSAMKWYLMYTNLPVVASVYVLVAVRWLYSLRLTLLVHPLEGVAAVAVLVDPPIRCAVVGEEHQTCVIALGRATEEVEGGVVV